MFFFEICFRTLPPNGSRPPPPCLPQAIGIFLKMFSQCFLPGTRFFFPQVFGSVAAAVVFDAVRYPGYVIFLPPPNGFIGYVFSCFRSRVFFYFFDLETNWSRFVAPPPPCNRYFSIIVFHFFHSHPFGLLGRKVATS